MTFITSALLLAVSAFAQDAEEDESDTVFVYQPDGTPRVVGSAHVVTEEELERYEYDDIGRVLNGTPGVYVRSEDGFGLRPNIGLRGANSDRSAKITLLEDGVPLVPAPYAAAAAYYFPMSTRLTGVEVFKGPAATAHGPQTVGGAVNLLTRRIPRKPDGAVDLGYGMRNTSKFHGWAGTGGARGGVLAEVSHVSTDGFKTLDTGGPTGFTRTDVMVKAGWNTDPELATRHALELKLGWGSEVSDETYLGLHIDDYADDPDRRYGSSALDEMEWRRTQIEATWRFDAGAVSLRTTAYHHWLDRQWFKFNRFRSGPSVHTLLQRPEGGASAVTLAILRGEEDSTVADQALMIGTNDRWFHSFGVQSRLRWRTRGEFLDSQLEAGIRIHGDIVGRLHTEGAYRMTDGLPVRDDTPLETTLESTATATAIAVFAQDDLAIGPLHLLPGIRSETIRTRYETPEETRGPDLRSHLLPGFAVLVEVSDSAQLFAGTHRGFSPVAPGQPAELRPETSLNTEAGLRIGSEPSRFEAVAFVNDYANITGQCTISGGCEGSDLDRQFNGGKAWVYGVEGVFAHEILLPSRLRVPISGTYTYTQSRFRTGFVSGFPQFGSVEPGDRLPYVPEHQGGLRVALEHDRFGLAANVSARTGMRDTASQGPIDETGVPGQVLLDLSARAQLDRHLGFYATVVNATNNRVLESWRPFGARPTAPFQAMLGLKIR